MLRAILFSFLLTPLLSSIYSLASLSSSTILVTSNLSSFTCAGTTIPNTFQVFPTNCQCNVSYLPSFNSSCSAISVASCTGALNYYAVYNLNGSMATPSCGTCAGNAYPNKNKTGCISCPTGMIYDTTQGCICNFTFTNYLKTSLGCFTTSISPPSTSSIYYSQLKYLIPGCKTFLDYLSCSQLINLCMYSIVINSGAITQPQCIFFTQYSLTNFIYPTSTSFSLTASKQASLQMKLISYLSTGNYLGEKSFQINDIFRCGTPSQSIGMSLGNNILTQCSYNFNNLAQQISASTYNDKVYQLYIMGSDGNYYEVVAYLQGSSQGIKRFYLQDSTSISGRIYVANSLTINLDLDSSGNLVNPSITIGYIQLSLETGVGITPASSATQSLSFSVTYSYSLSTFWPGAIASLIVVTCLALVHAVGKTYIGYLNRKSPLLFFLNFLGCWSLWLFYYLFFMTGYWFLFTKTTPNIFMLMPQSSQFYLIFYLLVGVMGILRIITILIDKNDKMNTEVFIVNWEKSTQNKNSWREIFIVNSLAEFYTHRTISIFWMLIVVLFFLTGIGWWKNAAETISTDLGSIYDFNPKNRVLMYFLGCAIFLAVGIVFKILRRLSVMFWPYPFEDFVDYCCITNLSLFFIKKRSPQAFYIHASMPDKTQVSYKQINQQVRKGIQKNRSLASELPSSQSLKLYNIYLSRQIEDKFAQMIRKQEDAEHNKHIKYASGSKQRKKLNKSSSSFRQIFTDQLTKYLQMVNSNRQNSRNQKSVCEYLFGFPPVNLRDDKALKSESKVYFDSRVELVSQVFPNGNQFQQIHTLIIIFLIWITLTNSPAIAAFLTYFVDEWMINGWIAWKCRDALEKMTRVKKGFMI